MGGGGTTNTYPTSINMGSRDLPEYVRPYYANLLNAVTGTVFSPYGQTSQPGQPGATGTGDSTGTPGAPGTPGANTGGLGGLYFQNPQLYPVQDMIVGGRQDFGDAYNRVQGLVDARNAAMGMPGIYDPYGGFSDERLWGAQGNLSSAMGGAGNIGNTYTGLESQFAGDAALSNKYNANNANTYYSIGQFNPAQVQYTDYLGGLAGKEYTAPQMQAARDIAAERSSVGKWGADTASEYMTPYQRAVTDVEKRQAKREYLENKTRNDAAAVKAGAFGGSRQAVLQGMNERSLMENLSDIEAKGMQRSWDQAQQQFERDRAANFGSQALNINTGLQAALANQGVQQQAAIQNLGAKLQTQGINANTALQAALGRQNASLQAGLANQGAAMQAQNMLENSRQFGANFWNQNSMNQAGMDLNAEQARRNLQMQALQGANQGYYTQGNLGTQMANLGTLGQQMDMNRINMAQQAGMAEEARRQAMLDAQRGNFEYSRNYPFQLASFYSGILNGVPTQMNSYDQTRTAYNPWAQYAGLGLAAYGMLNGGR